MTTRRLEERVTALEAARPPEPRRWAAVVARMSDGELAALRAIWAAAARRLGLALSSMRGTMLTGEELARIGELLERGAARAAMVASGRPTGRAG